MCVCVCVYSCPALLTASLAHVTQELLPLRDAVDVVRQLTHQLQNGKFPPRPGCDYTLQVSFSKSQELVHPPTECYRDKLYYDQHGALCNAEPAVKHTPVHGGFASFNYHIGFSYHFVV